MLKAHPCPLRAAEEIAAAARLQGTAREVAGRYASVVARYSCAQSSQRDRILFEPLYELLSLAVAAAFPAEHRHRRLPSPSRASLLVFTWLRTEGMMETSSLQDSPVTTMT